MAGGQSGGRGVAASWREGVPGAPAASEVQPLLHSGPRPVPTHLCQASQPGVLALRAGQRERVPGVSMARAAGSTGEGPGWAYLPPGGGWPGSTAGRRPPPPQLAQQLLCPGGRLDWHGTAPHPLRAARRSRASDLQAPWAWKVAPHQGPAHPLQPPLSSQHKARKAGLGVPFAAHEQKTRSAKPPSRAAGSVSRPGHPALPKRPSPATQPSSRWAPRCGPAQCPGASRRGKRARQGPVS